MPLDEHYFGLGDKTGPLDRRNEAFTIWNTDAYRFQESTDPLYKSIPYFMAFRAGRAIGVLLDNTWRSSFDFGKESPECLFLRRRRRADRLLPVLWPDPKQVVETYAWLTGPPPLPPLWSLGFQQSRYSYMTQARVLEIAAPAAQRTHSRRRHLSRHRLSGPQSPLHREPPTFPDLPGMIAAAQGGKLSRGDDHRPAHRQAARARLRSLRQRHGGRSLREESRRIGLCRQGVARAQRLSGFHAPANARLVGHALPRFPATTAQLASGTT